MSSCEPKKPSPPASGPAPATPPGSTLPCQKNPFKLTSETFATSPANRARTRIGVGEEVTIKTDPTVNATWSMSGGNGRLRGTSGTQIVFEAGDAAGSATITATGPDGCTATITFTVVEPANWTMKRVSPVKHHHGIPDCGWLGVMYLHPNDVNFYRVETREKDSQAVGTGSYSSMAGAWHGNYPPPDFASGWFAIIAHTEADGSTDNAPDQIYSGYPGSAAAGSAPPFTTGNMHFPILIQWRVGTGTVKDLPISRQEHEIYADGRCRTSKGGHTETSNYMDAENLPF